MKPPLPTFALAALCSPLRTAVAQEALSFDTSNGPLSVTPVGRGSRLFEYGDRVIHVDPYSEVADYAAQPDADLVWVTHDRSDYYDQAAIDAVSTDSTRFVMDSTSAEKIGGGERVTVMRNGDERMVDGIELRAVPAYNLVRGPESGSKFHPKVSTTATWRPSVTSPSTLLETPSVFRRWATWARSI